MLAFLQLFERHYLQSKSSYSIFKMGTESWPNLQGLITIVLTFGVLYGTKLLLSTVYCMIVGLRAHVWSRLRNKQLVETYGKWAVVTGCTDGIGKGYAYELARNGMNIVLISRTMAKLQQVSKDIRAEFGVETEIVQVDFSEGRKVYDVIQKHVQKKEIGILVNNVGIIPAYPMVFGEIPDDNVWGHVNVNVASVPAMTKLVLPVMLERRKGAIINLASSAARGPVPLLGIYSASKSFVEFFSEALRYEYQGSGITVQTVTPFYVSSNMTSYNEKIYNPSFFVPSSSTFAASALNTLGYTDYTTGYWTHGIMAYVVDNFYTRNFWGTMAKYTNEHLVRTMKRKTQ